MQKPVKRLKWTVCFFIMSHTRDSTMCFLGQSLHHRITEYYSFSRPYPISELPETSESLDFWHFQGIYKWNIGLKRINDSECV